jgi:hydrogenase nickel incorporation protein HypA/HybF
MGELQQIETDILEFALSQLKSDKMKDAKITVETVPAKLKCRVCGQAWTFDEKKLDKESKEAVHFVPEIAHTFIKCPKCGSPDFEILEGRGVWLESVKGEK